MRKTYAYNSIIFGFLIGLLVYGVKESLVLAVLVGLAVSIVGFVLIRAIENAMDRAGDVIIDAVGKKVDEKRKEKKKQN